MARRPSGQEHDPSRRQFFKTFSRQTLQNAGAVAGAAAELRRTSLTAARELLDMDTPTAIQAPTASRVVTPPAMEVAAQETFRSAYRFTGTSVVVLDQRELPARVITFECPAATDVASALRSGAITPGPVMGQIAAYGVALAAVQSVDRSDESRDQYVRTSADAIKSAHGAVAAVRHAVVRMTARYDELANSGASGGAIRDGLVAEADAITTDAIAACTQIGRAWSELVVGDPVNLLVHGDGGPLTCGMVGTVTAGIQLLIEQGRRVHVWVTAAAPSDEGTRVTALQLTQLDIPHTLIPDSALGWLLASRRLQGVVLRGDTVTSNGDTIALLGARAVAEIAASSNVPVYVLAPEASWDRPQRDASSLVFDLRSAAELGSAHRARLNPPFDVVPARIVTAYVSERAVVRPPFKEPR